MADKKVLEIINILADHQCLDCWHYGAVVYDGEISHYCKKNIIRKRIEWSNTCMNFKQTTPERFLNSIKHREELPSAQ